MILRVLFLVGYISAGVVTGWVIEQKTGENLNLLQEAGYVFVWPGIVVGKYLMSETK